MNQNSIIFTLVIMAVVGVVANMVRGNLGNNNHRIAIAATVLIAVNLLWLLYYDFLVAAILVSIAIVLGISPNIRARIIAWIFQPRNIRWLIGGAIIIYLIMHRELWSQLGVLLIILVGYAVLVIGIRRSFRWPRQRS